jgi:hypothetical protein
MELKLVLPWFSKDIQFYCSAYIMCLEMGLNDVWHRTDNTDLLKYFVSQNCPLVLIAPLYRCQVHMTVRVKIYLTLRWSAHTFSAIFPTSLFLMFIYWSSLSLSVFMISGHRSFFSHLQNLLTCSQIFQHCLFAYLAELFMFHISYRENLVTNRRLFCNKYTDCS